MSFSAKLAHRDVSNAELSPKLVSRIQDLMIQSEIATIELEAQLDLWRNINGKRNRGYIKLKNALSGILHPKDVGDAVRADLIEMGYIVSRKSGGWHSQARKGTDRMRENSRDKKADDWQASNIDRIHPEAICINGFKYSLNPPDPLTGTIRLRGEILDCHAARLRRIEGLETTLVEL